MAIEQEMTPEEYWRWLKFQVRFLILWWFCMLCFSCSGCTFSVDGLDKFDTNFQPIVDLGIQSDLEDGAIAQPPDLTVLPDLTPIPPDLIHVPVYDPDIQALITSMTCDTSSCHGSTNPVATSPVLIASPTTMAEYKHNYDQVLPYSQMGMSSTILTRPLMTDPSLHPKSFADTNDPRYIEILFWITKTNPFQ